MANEVRLIDANALLLEIEEELQYESPRFTAEQNKLIDMGLRIAAKDIRHRPTVDAVPVVHGEWVTLEDDWTLDTIYQCSVCKEEFVTIDGTPAENLWNYCPHCGAKMMDGDGNE